MNCCYQGNDCDAALAVLNVDDWLGVASPAGHLFDGLAWLLRAAQEWQTQFELNLAVSGYSVQVYAMDSVLLRARTLFEFFTGTGKNYCHAHCFFNLTAQIPRPTNFTNLNNALHQSSLHLQNRSKTKQLRSHDGKTLKDLNLMPPDIARAVIDIWHNFETELQNTGSACYSKAKLCRQQAEQDSREIVKSVALRSGAYSMLGGSPISLTTLF